MELKTRGTDYQQHVDPRIFSGILNACAREYLRSPESDHTKLTGTNQSRDHLHRVQCRHSYILPYNDSFQQVRKGTYINLISRHLGIFFQWLNFFSLAYFQ